MIRTQIEIENQFQVMFSSKSKMIQAPHEGCDFTKRKYPAEPTQVLSLHFGHSNSFISIELAYTTHKGRKSSCLLI